MCNTMISVGVISEIHIGVSKEKCCQVLLAVEPLLADF